MALLTAGTKTTSSLSAIQYQPSGISATDFANLNELIKVPANLPNIGGDNVTSKKMWIQNNTLYVPNGRTPAGYALQPGDYIMVDGAGWPIVVPASIFSTSWQHS